MNPEDVGRVLDELGERIGPAGEYAWQLTVRQVVIDAALWGALGLFLVALGIFTFALLRRNDREADVENRLGLGNALGLTAWALLPGLIVVVTVGTTILNPEYHAMMRLLDRLVLQ